MRNFSLIDEETAIEEYSSYIGMSWDGELCIHVDFKTFQQYECD